MAQSVDTKIVELKFNNDNFAEKIDSTLTKLEQLNKDIEEVGFTEAFKNLSKGVKDVDVSSISDGVNEVSKGFSKMEIFAITALANISNSIVNVGKRIASNLVKPLKQGVLQGGLQRARNIEQATFQFEGQKISKSAGNETLSYYKEVMDAVLGTSYSYDVAAKAASQLAASNVGVIETEKRLADGTTITAKTLDSGMTKALLGIAGVAAMTGSDFDSISQIFTRVAGQGRVMAVDLNSIASRGLNAAAVLANYLGKTEEEVRDMVSKGKISFEDFSNAMSEAFGQHAKDSTLMFQGALDDVNAALARIGADFYGPALDAGRDLLNSITPLVDAVHNRLNPALEKTNNLMTTASKRFSQYLDMLSYLIERFPNGKESMGGWISEHMNAWTNIADLYKRGDVKKAIDGLQEFSKADEKLRGKKGEGIDGRQMIADYYNLSKNVELLSKYLGKSDGEVQKLVDDGKIGAKELSTVIDGMIDDGIIGFNEFYKAFHKLWSESSDLTSIVGVTEAFDNYVRTCIRAEEPSERFNRHVDTFFSIVKGAQSLFGSVQKIAVGFLDIIMSLLRYMAPLGNLFVQVVEIFANFVVQVADFIATSDSFQTVIQSIIGLLGKFFDLLNLNKTVPMVLNAITKVFDFLANVIERVHNGVSKLVVTVNNTIGKVVDKVLDILSNTELLTKILENLRTAGITVVLIQLIGAITRPMELLEAFGKSIGSVGKSISGVFDKLGGVFKSISGMVGKVGEALDEVTSSLKKLQELIVATVILEIAFAIAVLAASLYLLSKVNVEKAADALVPLVSYGTVISSLIGVMVTISKFGKKLKDIDKVGKAFLEMAVAVGVMALAIYALSRIKPKQLYSALGAVEALLITLAGIAKLLSGKTTKDTGLKALWSGKMTKNGDMTKGLMGLVAMAEAVKILAKALVSVAQVGDPDALVTSWAIIELLLGSMFLIVKALSDDKVKKMTKGVGALLAMAISIRLLVRPITELAALASNGDAVWQAVGIIGALLGAMTLLTIWLGDSKGAIKGGLGLILMATAVKILSTAISEMASSVAVDSDILWNAFGILALAVTGLVLALNLVNTDGLISKSIAFLAVAYALNVLAGIMLSLGANSDAAWAGIGAAAVALVVLGAACWGFSKVPIGGILKIFLTLAGAALLVAGFGAAIGIFGVGLALFGAGLTSLASGVEAIGKILPQFLTFVAIFGVILGLLMTAGAPAILVIIGISVAFLALGGAMALLGNGLQNTAAAIKLMSELEGKLSSTAKGIRDFVKNLTKMSSDAETVSSAADGIAKSLTRIGNAALKANTNTKALTNVGKNLANNLTKGVTSGAKAMEKAASDLSTKATNKLKSRYDSWKSIGSYLIKGMINGISSQQGALESQVKKLEDKAERAVKAKAKIKSPSRVWMQIGSYMGQGLAIGIRDSSSSVRDAATGIAETSEDAIQKAINAISHSVDSDLDLNPVITPVVDLSNVDKSASMIGSAFGSRIGIGADLANAIGNNIQNGGKDSAINKLANKLDAMTESMNSRALNNYITIDGTGDPEEFANGLINGFRLNARTV